MAERNNPPKLPESPDPNERMRNREAQIDRLPVGAEFLIKKLLSVEIGQFGNVDKLKAVVDQVEAYKEGLTLGIKGRAYEFEPTNPKDKLKVANLQRMFTTVEGATDRPMTATSYINAALDNALDDRILAAEDYHNNPEVFRQNLENSYRDRNNAMSRAGHPELVLDEVQVKQAVDREVSNKANEYLAIDALIEIKSMVETRAIFDKLFDIRMKTCEDPNLGSKVGTPEVPAPTPDSAHFAILFGGEVSRDFSQGVNNSIEEIVKLGLPDSVITRLGMEPIPDEVRKQIKPDVYSTGLNTGVAFGTWLKHLLEKSGKRMDVVWNAWKLALTTEVIGSLGETINSKGQFVLGTPPYESTVMTYPAHLREKRMIEYGLKADGTRLSNEKFVGHSGHPLSIDHIPDLCADYFKESSIELNAVGMSVFAKNIDLVYKNIPVKGDPDFQEKYTELKKNLQKFTGDNLQKLLSDASKDTIKISLWDLWLYGRLSFADENFPWYLTDQPSAEATANELPPGLFGGWLLTRSRSASIAEDIKSIPPLRDLGSPDFFTKRLRNWTKVLGKVSDELPVNDNPRMWWMLGICAAHQTGVNRDTTGIANMGTPKSPYKDLYNDNHKILKNSVKYVFFSPSEEPGIQRAGMDQKGVPWSEIFGAAMQSGFLRDADVAFIRKTLNIKDIY